MSQDFYQLLEVNKTASAEEIQKSYRRLARKYHPDLNPDDKSAQQKFKDIQHAYDVLNDPEKRRMYDQLGPDFERMGGGAGPFPGGSPFPGGQGFEQVFGNNGGGGFGFNSLDELFQQMGGGGGGRSRSRGRSGGTRRPSRGSDVRVQLDVPFNTAVLGGSASIAITRGDKKETIQLRVPSGVVSGNKMRLRGQGNAGESGGESGDLIVELSVSPHPVFRRNGFNLELTLPITLKEAVMGTTIDIPAPSGIVSLKIPPGSSSGKKLRIKAQGIHDSKGNIGDLIVELQIKLPSELNKPDQIPPSLQQAAEALEQLYDQPVRKEIRW